MIRRRKEKGAKRYSTVRASAVPRPGAGIRRAMESLDGHNAACCTVCTRRRDRVRRAGFTASAANDNDDERWEEEPTMRPTMPADEAVIKVLSQLEDEFRHLKLTYQDEVEQYERVDPAIGKRRRKGIVQKLKGTVEKLEGKADQIYALYDVLEANHATEKYVGRKEGGVNGGIQSEGIWSSSMPMRFV